ncbi:MAG: DEAD/DEAH box helicase [Caldilineaceae bacterium]|nr:DEAD/DEAH box helicase [Caldilineaceae bacterium]
MALAELLTALRADHGFMANVMAWRSVPAQSPRYAPMPSALHVALQTVLSQRGIPQLYTHQAQAVEQALASQHVVVVTPTASGKTLCYNLPVLHQLLHEPQARALYLFPTKALAHDQLTELTTWQQALANALPQPLHVASYDGDTTSAARPRVRRQSRLILSNPDMLHTGILPYHTHWEAFFANLRYVVLDELHTYRGIFGSHVANVLRRLQRICAFYGSHPQFICASATIANPQQLAERLLEQPVTLVRENGAPSGPKQIILYNPPLYDAERGLRQSALLEAQELAARCVRAGLQTILFGRSRLTTEVLLSYLRDKVGLPPSWQRPDAPPVPAAATIADPQTAIRGYRGGYLPQERRTIEAGLRNGTVRAVVATNALELGIDIGGLQAAVLCGYPGTIASVWQQMGRAGRTQEGALAILVATGGLLDQYVIQHPDFLFDQSPEHALINPDNLMLLIDQLRCAAFELPFGPTDSFGASPFTADALQLLAEGGEVQQHQGRFFWSGAGYPATQISLRSAGSETVAIQVAARGAWGAGARSVGLPTVDVLLDDAPSPASAATLAPSSPTVIGQLDRATAPNLLYTGAIYLHEGQSYQVEQLDLTNKLATVTPVTVDYYTEVTTEAEVTVLQELETRLVTGARVAYGDLQVRSQVVGFRRIKRFTHETLGAFPLDYPPQLLETTGYWLGVLPQTQIQLAQQGQWFDSLNNYGPNWQEQRRRVRVRDHYRCTQCGAPEPPGRQHDVHHLVPFRTFGYVPGFNDHYQAANRLENLVLVCRPCHRRLESGVRTRTGLDGLAYALTNIAPLHLMCDPQDLGVHVVRSEGVGEESGIVGQRAAGRGAEDSGAAGRGVLPSIYLYERVTAGLGFSERLFASHDELLVAAQRLVRACPCRHGCPACVGPVLEQDLALLETKQLTLALLTVLIGP